MRNRFLLALWCVLVWTKEAQSENEYEVKKKGVFPFMAILYYPDETVVDASGNRFLRAAVLFKPEWLLSGAIDHSVLDNVPLGFPRKTLLARMGALTLDVNITLNEDDDEQEREVIRIVKPHNHNKESWWTTDITLLETLPFKLTSVVAPTAINPKRTYVDNNCAILFYTKKYGSTTDVKFLMQLGVQLMPASTENCGAHFSSATMICASHDPADDIKSIYDLEFCPGNSGGPLLCEGEVMALQTYIENNCKQPHLYQLLAPWDTLINCALEQKCNANDDVCNVCTSTHKDDPAVKTFPNNTQLHTAKEITSEAYLESVQIPENFVVEKSTSFEIPTELPSRTPTVLEANYSTVSYLTESDKLEQTISSLSNVNEALAPEQSSTSEKSQSFSSELLEISIGTSQKMESPGLEKLTESPTSKITVSTFTTPSWLETPQIDSQRRFMAFSSDKDKEITVTVKNELPKSTKLTTKIREWPRKKPVDKVKSAARLRVQSKQKKNENNSSRHYMKKKKLKKRRRYSEANRRAASPQVLTEDSSDDDGASNRAITIPLILLLITLIFLI